MGREGQVPATVTVLGLATVQAEPDEIRLSVTVRAIADAPDVALADARDRPAAYAPSATV